MDRALGRLFDALRERGLYGDTTILVVGDHGEGLGDHGEASHGAFVFDSTLRVPFLLRRADGGRAAGRSHEIASVADVHPTLAEALGLPPAPGLDGLSLYSGELDPARGVYFESYEGYLTFGWSPIAGWATRAGKYVHSPAPELYLVETDPNEAHNVVAEHADALAGYRAGLARVAAEPALPGAEVGGDAEGLMRELRALGYSGAGPRTAPARPAGGERAPEPAHAHRGLRALRARARARAAEARRRGRAHSRGARGRGPARLERLVPARGGPLAGRALRGVPRRARAQPRPAGSWEGVEVNLGFCCEALGRTDEAIEHFARAVEQEPRWTEITEKLIALLEGQKRSDEAERYRAALRAAPAAGAPPPAGDG
jgi:tetratricopeptide (TPR) repeat protein